MKLYVSLNLLPSPPSSSSVAEEPYRLTRATCHWPSSTATALSHISRSSVRREFRLYRKCKRLSLICKNLNYKCNMCIKISYLQLNVFLMIYKNSLTEW